MRRMEQVHVIRIQHYVEGLGLCGISREKRTSFQCQPSALALRAPRLHRERITVRH